jgi:hypothetical protein
VSHSNLQFVFLFLFYHTLSVRSSFCPTVATNSTGTFHLIVPLKSRKDFFLQFHNIAHPGRLSSHCIISSRFVLRGLSSDITAWTCERLACQRGKIHRHTPLAPQPIPIPQQRFSHLHVDLVGLLQYSNNFNYIFTIIDCTYPNGWKLFPFLIRLRWHAQRF